MKLGQMARLVRSKTAGPFEMTFDVMFDDEASYLAAKRSGCISASWVASTYQVPEKSVRIYNYDPGLAIKATIPRSCPAGEVGERDVFAAQQYAPFLDLEVTDISLSPSRGAEHPEEATT